MLNIMGVTKNIQTTETIRNMTKVSFPNKEFKSSTELTDGMCNAAYLVEFADGDKSILKIASGDGIGLMSNEVNMMQAEINAMRIVREQGKVRVAEVQYYDTSKSICSGDYFFMEMLDGQSLFKIKEQLSGEQLNKINYEIGSIEKTLSEIKGEKFGLLGDNEHQFECLFDFTFYLIKNALSDAEKAAVEIGVPTEEILSKLTADRAVFEQVQNPVLVHWDMWEGNLFVKDGHISGVIDWERALWGEPFMDDRFRRHTRNQEFLRGFGKEKLTADEMRRIYWYDIFLYLTMMSEVTYRQYEDDGQYKWARSLFEASYQEITNC